MCVCVACNWRVAGERTDENYDSDSLSKSMKTTTTTTTTCPVVTAITPAYKRAYSVYRSYLCYSSQGHVRCSQYFRRSDDDFIPFAARTRAHTTHTHTHADKSVRVCRCVRTPCILFWFHCVPAHEVSIWSTGLLLLRILSSFSLYFSLRLSPP